MSAAAAVNPLIAALRSARESWVEVAPGKRLKIRRPTEAEFPAFLRKTEAGRGIAVELEHVQRHVVDWEGFSEADLLGPTVGVSDALPFDAAVWAEVVADHLEWMQPAAQALVQAIVSHLTAQADAAGNSAATSTPGPAAGVATPVQTSALSTMPTTPSA